MSAIIDAPDNHTVSVVDTPAILLLNETIQQRPDEPVNYLLRAEARLRAGDRRQAAEDFVTARELAARRYAQSAWGYLDQAYCDRAQAGLAACQGALPASVSLKGEDQAHRETRRIVETDAL